MFDRSLKLGMLGEDVLQLQILLNKEGITVSESGFGSSGKETTYFGSKTESAVTRFQDKYASEILAPVGLSTGTGYFGPSTRAKANALIE